MSDPRDRRLDEMLEAARGERPRGMSEEEAAAVLSRVWTRVREDPVRRTRARLVLWLAGLAAAAAVAGVWMKPAPVQTPRVARQTVIHVESGGKEVLIQAIAYEPEE